MDPFLFLRTKSEQERSLMQAIAVAALELQRLEDSDRANKIAKAVWEAVS